MRTIEQMIQSEVLCCMSSMVSTLANAQGLLPHNVENARPAHDLCEQAAELCYPIPDYEEAALENGAKIFKGDDGWEWRFVEAATDTVVASGSGYATAEEAAQAACEEKECDPYDREVFEHWAVTDWFADKLLAEGEKVDKDFAGLCVWARTTTGQAISADGMIERLYAKLNRPHLQES